MADKRWEDIPRVKGGKTVPKARVGKGEGGINKHIGLGGVYGMWDSDSRRDCLPTFLCKLWKEHLPS